MSHQIKRSALLGVIGTLSKKLFGTMDEEDAIRYDNAIHEIQTDTSKIASILKENILVTTSTLKSYNNTLEAIKSNEHELNVAIDALYEDIKNLTYISRELGIRSRILELTSMLENSLLALSFKVEDIVNSVMFGKSNILYPSILSPVELYTQLVDNYRFISDSRQLPVLLCLDNVHIILNVSSISSYFSKDQIVFVLEIPLVKPQRFSLYHNLPCPVPHEANNPVSFTTIIPSSKYVAITKDRSTYCKLDELGGCKIVNSNHYLCDVRISYSVAATPCCETEIISKVLTSIPEICKTKFFHGQVNIWQTLQNNKWLYVMSEKSKLNIECNNVNQLTEIDISGSGILYLPRGCVAYCKDTQLISQDNVNILLKPIETNLNIINDSCCNRLSFNNMIPNLPPISLKNVNLDSVAYNPEMLKNLDRIIEKPVNPHIVQYGNYYSVIIIITLILITLYLLYKICKTDTLKKLHPFNRNNRGNNNNPELADVEIEIAQSVPAPALRIG